MKNVFTKKGVIYRRILCCGIVEAKYLGYKTRPYKAHRYQCPVCKEISLGESPRFEYNKKRKIIEAKEEGNDVVL